MNPGASRLRLGRSQSVLPHAQYVAAGVEIAVYHDPTAGAGVDALRKRERLAMSALRAILRRVRWVHSHEGSTSPCCLVGQQNCELTPGGVMDALGEAMVMHHA